MKKLLSMILASVMVLSLLAGCGGGNNQAPNQNDKPQQSEDKNSGSAPSEPSEPDAPAAGGSITVAALASGYEEAYPGMWQEVCDAFTAETGIEVELIVDKMLEDVIGPAMQGGDFPDVIHLATGREKGLTEQFIKDNNIAELTDVLSMTVPGERPGLYLMVDGFQGYDKLKNVKRCACYAHIRRYFLDAIPKGSEKDLSNPAVQGVAYCDKLFWYERIYKEQGLSHEQRQKRRMKDEKPVVDAFIKWLDQQKMSASSNKFNKALTYARNRQDILLTYLEDGRCSLSNNMSENSIRPVVVGRKNWLFSDTVGGAEASMGIYTIVEMAKFHGLDPYKYMKYILEQRPSYRSTDEELEKLAPWSSSCQEICK